MLLSPFRGGFVLASPNQSVPKEYVEAFYRELFTQTSELGFFMDSNTPTHALLFTLGEKKQVIGRIGILFDHKHECFNVERPSEEEPFNIYGISNDPRLKLPTDTVIRASFNTAEAFSTFTQLIEKGQISHEPEVPYLYRFHVCQMDETSHAALSTLLFNDEQHYPVAVDGDTYYILDHTGNAVGKHSHKRWVLYTFDAVLAQKVAGCLRGYAPPATGWGRLDDIELPGKGNLASFLARS